LTIKENILGTHFIQLDESSFELLYQQFAPKLYRICYQQLQNEDLSGDIIHNVFLSIWERRETLIIDNPEAFLVRATKMQILKHFRDNSSRKSHIEQSLKDYSEADSSTLQLIYFNNLSENVQALVQQLPPQCRRVYLMRDQQGLNNIEIADQLGISVSAVKQHIGNALAFLRKHISY